MTLVTSTGLTFSGEVAVATRSPAVDARYLGTFALLGVYAGVIPVFIGLLWLPFVRAVDRRWIDFFLSLTIGLLVFLGVDALEEAIETAALVPGAFQGLALVLLGVAGHARWCSRRSGEWRARARGERSPLYVAGLIALGIGLHNLGEGLAIGTSYATGEIALGTFLVVGFLLHNTTEGLGIVTPLADERPRLRHADPPRRARRRADGVRRLDRRVHLLAGLDHAVLRGRRRGHRAGGLRAVAAVRPTRAGAGITAPLNAAGLAGWECWSCTRPDCW